MTETMFVFSCQDLEMISERKFQLHEVIRLSGMNIIINDLDQPLLIKVASLPNERMQVYFIDNEEYFKRKQLYFDDEGVAFSDNDERAISSSQEELSKQLKTKLGTGCYSPERLDGFIHSVIP